MYWTAPKLTLLATPAFTMPSDAPITWPDGNQATDAEALVEYAGRLCYKSRHNPAQKTTAHYLDNILQQAHGSVLEHATVSVLIEGVSRALTHELIRHRAGTAISQVSQRFVDESDCDFVIPPLLLDRPERVAQWAASCERSLADYQALVAQLLDDPAVQDLPPVLRRKRVRECARGVLPNSVETKLVWTANLRTLRHVLALRGDLSADAEILRLMHALLDCVRPVAPAVFGDFAVTPDGIALTSTYHKV